MSNPISQLHSYFAIHTPYLTTFSVHNVCLSSIYQQAFDGSKFNLIFTTDYHICCMAPITTVCTAFKPWYISCCDILPSLGMKVFYIIVSVVVFMLNILSIILQSISYQSNKVFSLIVMLINANDILCGLYLCNVWLVDIYFGDSFQVKEELWRSGILCLTAFTTVLFFTVLTECLLIILSLSRLMVVIYPLDSRFKETLFVAKILISDISVTLFLSVLATFIFNTIDNTIKISICLPF